jgi:hypothetical protein
MRAAWLSHPGHEQVSRVYTPTKREILAGVVTAHTGDRLEDGIRLADERRYASKRSYYIDAIHKRRQPT